MLEDYLKFNFTIDFDYEAIYDVIEDLGIVNIFAIEKSLKKVFELKFKNTRFLHSSTSLIHQLNILNRSLSGENIYVYVHAFPCISIIKHSILKQIINSIQLNFVISHVF